MTQARETYSLPAPGDLLVSASRTNVWSCHSGVSPARVVDWLDFKKTVLVLQVHCHEANGVTSADVLVLTPNGVAGWVTLDKLTSTWMLT